MSENEDSYTRKETNSNTQDEANMMTMMRILMIRATMTALMIMMIKSRHGPWSLAFSVHKTNKPSSRVDWLAV